MLQITEGGARDTGGTLQVRVGGARDTVGTLQVRGGGARDTGVILLRLKRTLLTPTAVDSSAISRYHQIFVGLKSAGVTVIIRRHTNCQLTQNRSTLNESTTQLSDPSQH